MLLPSRMSATAAVAPPSYLPAASSQQTPAPGQVAPRPGLVVGALAVTGWTLLLAFLVPVLVLVALAMIPSGLRGDELALGTLGALFGLAALGLILAIPDVHRRVRGLELPGTARGGLRRLSPLLVVAAAYSVLHVAVEGRPGIATVGYALALSAFAGASEEMWRALALRALGGRQRPWLALISTSVVFGALHLAALSAPSLAHAVAAAILGAAFGVAILRGVPVVVVAGVHAAYDLLLLVMLGGTYQQAIRELEAEPMTLGSLLPVAPLVLAGVVALVLGVRALRRARAAGV